MGIFNGNGSNNVITGSSTDDEIDGNGGDDVLIGIGGNDKLDGGSGADTMDGGSGDDTYIVDNVNDKVVEYANKGKDTIKSSVTYSLNFAPNVENLILTGTADIDAYGDNSNNGLYGNSGDNILWASGGHDTLKGGGGDDYLNGGAGHDDMYGGTGDDQYVVTDAWDTVTEYADQGIDTVFSSYGHTLDANVENLVLTGWNDNYAKGNELNNELSGNSGNNSLWGGGGADTMQGGEGNDEYYIDEGGDEVIEYADEGNDLVRSRVSHALGDNFERLFLNGEGNTVGSGNGLDNQLVGNVGNNVLFGNGGHDTIDGAEGNDTMYGGEGDDLFAVDTGADKVIEYDGDGNDSVYLAADIDYTLPADVENLYLFPEGDGSGTGNTLNNIIKGNYDNNTLDGSLGQDTMYGSLGNDTYYVDNDGDVTVEQVNQGNDFVYSTVNLTLADNIETLSLQIGDAVSATGNAAHNTLFGNGNDNVLDGGGANDILSGLGGNDTFVFQAGQANGDVVYEFQGNGAGVGDVLKFEGYGPGATFTQQTATEWFITSGDGTIQEVITLIGGPSVHASDYLFA